MVLRLPLQLSACPALCPADPFLPPPLCSPSRPLLPWILGCLPSALMFIYESDFKNRRLSIFLTYVPLPGGNNNK